MAMKASAARPTKKTRLDFGGDGDLNIVWRPSSLTGAQMDELIVAETTRPVFDALVATVMEWDLLGDDGAVLPLDADVLHASIPVDLVHEIIRRLGTDGAGEANGAS